MSSDKERRLRLARGISVLTAVGVVGLSGMLITLFPSPGQQPSPALMLGLVSNALFSGALTAIIFNTLASREAEQQMDVILERVLRQVFMPIRSVLDVGAIGHYRFVTHLTAPAADDPHPEYAVQLIRLAYTRRTLPAQVSMVCIASMDDRAADPYADPDRYLMRWQIEEHLMPDDRAMFAPGSLTVDGEEVSCSVRPKMVREMRICEYVYQIPRHLRRSSSNRVEIAVATRKYIMDAHVIVKVVLFANVTDAEFYCTLDGSVACDRLSVAANVAGLGPRGESSVGSTYSDLHRGLAAHAHYRYPLQAGSSITFYLDRKERGRIGSEAGA
ncbi:hypothetical protein [Microbispora bryophytorum]|uniref:hypothetical protein n=1 Tax=Microbispora bryophytorum TaxID=1460882 RepID=UPI0037108949